MTGIEPARVGATIRCVNHFTTCAITLAQFDVRLLLYIKKIICKEKPLKKIKKMLKYF